jgi:glycosyltransferase involved in cell wall biosynthesis
MMQKEKILFVIPLYGDVPGGGERLCRFLAEKLTPYFDVEVATTKAKSFSSWKNYFEKDSETINNVLVRRFATKFERSGDNIQTQQFLRLEPANHELFLRWLIEQGPVAEGLIDFVSTNHQNYKKIIVFQYLYATAYKTIEAVSADKLVFVPLAHDEPAIKFAGFFDMFQKPKWLMYCSEAEKRVVDRFHFLATRRHEIAGGGVDVPEKIVSEEEIKKKYNLEKFLVYVGRIDPSKGVAELVDYFIEYKKQNKSNLKLVLVGKEVRRMRSHEDVIETGFVREEEKFGLIRASDALVNPSQFESLSFVVLEAFFMKRPVVVNSLCEVTRTHCQEAQAGLWYSNYGEFEQVIKYLQNKPEIADQMGANGYEYASLYYTWEKVISKWVDVLKS